MSELWVLVRVYYADWSSDDPDNWREWVSVMGVFSSALAGRRFVASDDDQRDLVWRPECREHGKILRAEFEDAGGDRGYYLLDSLIHDGREP